MKAKNLIPWKEVVDRRLVLEIGKPNGHIDIRIPHGDRQGGRLLGKLTQAQLDARDTQGIKIVTLLLNRHGKVVHAFGKQEPTPPILRSSGLGRGYCAFAHSGGLAAARPLAEDASGFRG